MLFGLLFRAKEQSLFPGSSDRSRDVEAPPPDLPRLVVGRYDALVDVDPNGGPDCIFHGVNLDSFWTVCLFQAGATVNERPPQVIACEGL